MNPTTATFLGTLFGALAMVATAAVTQWASRRNTHDTARLESRKAELDAQESQAKRAQEERAADLKRLYDGLWDQLNAMKGQVGSLEDSIKGLRIENADLRGDRGTLSVRIEQQTRRIEDQEREIERLRKRVAELEGKIA